MGFIGLLITIGIMVLGMSYYFFGMAPASSLTFINDTDISKGGEASVPSQAQAFIEQAKEVKARVENKSVEEVKSTEEVKETEIPKTTTASQEKGAPAITSRLMKTGFSIPSKLRTIDTIVLHSSYNPDEGGAYDVSAIVKIYERYGVSAHYLIDRNGAIYRLVSDQNIAYHAGVSKMPDGRKNINDFSIGIEIMNKENAEYTGAQYEAVNNLIAYLKTKYHIKSVVGHADIAPGRKTDPWNFDWKKLQ